MGCVHWCTLMHVGAFYNRETPINVHYYWCATMDVHNARLCTNVHKWVVSSISISTDVTHPRHFFFPQSPIMIVNYHHSDADARRMYAHTHVRTQDTCTRQVRAHTNALASTAIFVWIDGFSFSALIGSKIFGKIPGISIRAARILQRIFHFGWVFY